MALCIIHAVVNVVTRTQARWWIKRFAQIHDEFPTLVENGPQVVLALAISYPRREGRSRGLWFRRTDEDVAGHFKARYPYEFHGERRTTPKRFGRETNLIVRRLSPVSPSHVENWYDHLEVKENMGRAAAAYAAKLTHQDADVRRSATAALGKLGPAAAASEAHVVRLLNDSNAGVRVAATATLRKIRSDRESFIKQAVRSIFQDSKELPMRHVKGCLASLLRRHSIRRISRGYPYGDLLQWQRD